MILGLSPNRINAPSPSDPATSDEFDQAITNVYTKYISGTPLTRAELAQLINATTRLMRGAN